MVKVHNYKSLLPREKVSSRSETDEGKRSELRILEKAANQSLLLEEKVGGFSRSDEV